MIVLNTEMSDEYTNILTNVVLPFDPRRTKLLLGTLEYIAAEVIVAKVVRKIMRADNRGWLQLAYVHALSMPFLGGGRWILRPTGAIHRKRFQGEEDRVCHPAMGWCQGYPRGNPRAIYRGFFREGLPRAVVQLQRSADHSGVEGADATTRRVHLRVSAQRRSQQSHHR